MRRRTSRSARAGESGAAAVEFALIAPLLLLLVFGGIQYGLYFWAVQGGSDIARSAARSAAVGEPATCVAFRNDVRSDIDALTGSGSGAVISRASTPRATGAAGGRQGQRQRQLPQLRPAAAVPAPRRRWPGHVDRGVARRVRAHPARGVPVRRRRRDESGAVAVLVALLAVVLFASAALSVDLGNAWARKRTVQKQVDVSALAAGWMLPLTAANRTAVVDEVATYLEENRTTGQAPISAAQLRNGRTDDGEVTFSARRRVVRGRLHRDDRRGPGGHRHLRVGACDRLLLDDRPALGDRPSRLGAARQVQDHPLLAPQRVRRRPGERRHHRRELRGCGHRRGGSAAGPSPSPSPSPRTRCRGDRAGRDPPHQRGAPP